MVYVTCVAVKLFDVKCQGGIPYSRNLLREEIFANLAVLLSEEIFANF